MIADASLDISELLSEHLPPLLLIPKHMIYFLLSCGVFLEPECAVGVLLLHFSSGHRRSNVGYKYALVVSYQFSH